jgi:outer membrane protein TolC
MDCSLKKIFITILLFTLPTIAFASSFTLEQCLERGLAFNPQVKAYQLAVEEAGQGVNEAWGGFLPTLSVNYSYSQLNNGNSSDRDTDYLDQNSDTVSVRVSQPLFSGLSSIATLKRARQSKQYRQTELIYMQRQLAREISIKFYDLIYALQRAEQWQTSLTRLEKQEQIASAWVNQELAPRLRLLEVQVELSNARHQFIRANTDASIAQAQLRELLDFDIDHTMTVVGSLVSPYAPPCPDLLECLNRATQRPEITLAQTNVEMAIQEAKIILARNFPQANIDASWVDYQRDYDNREYSDDKRDYYSVALNLSFPLFQGGRTISAWRKQRIAVDRLRQVVKQQTNAIVSEVQTRYRQYVESQARITNANDALVAAREAYALASRSAGLGVVSLNDLLDSELRLTRVEITLLDSNYAMQQAHVQLNYAVGDCRILNDPLQKE